MATKAFGIRIGITDADKARRELEQLGERGQKALERINNVSAPPGKGLAAVNAAAGEARVGLEGLGSRAGVVGSALSGLGAVGLGAAAGIGALTIGLGKAISAAEQFERSTFKIEALLKTSGGASGQTAESIERLARALGEETLASTDGVRKAAAQLLTFKSISGDAFETTLRLAQDLAALGFGNLEGATKQLGKALEDPKRGLASLREVGVSFTATQTEMIEKMVEAGDKAGAQRVIFETLQSQIGGAGKAEAGGLAGAYDTLSERIGVFLENVGNSGPVQTAAAAINTLAAAVKSLNDGLFPTTERALADARKKVATLKEMQGFGDVPGFDNPEQLAREIAQAEQLVRTWEAVLETDRQREEIAKRAGQRAQQQAAAEEKAANERAKMEKQEKERAKEKEKWIGQINAAIERGAEAQKKARESLEAQIAGLVDEQAQLEMTDRERFIHVKLLQAEQTARQENIKDIDDYLARIRKEAGALYDRNKVLKDAADREKEIKREQERAMDAAQREAERTIGRITDFGADMLFGWFKGTSDGWKGMWSDMKDFALRTIAQIAAKNIVTPIICPVAGRLSNPQGD